MKNYPHPQESEGLVTWFRREGDGEEEGEGGGGGIGW